MKVLLTGAAGFLGWHTRVRLRALTDHEVVAVGRDQWTELADHARGVDAIVHVAGINRASDTEVERGNIDLAAAVADAVRASGSAPRIVFANSTQSGNNSAYGTGKARAAELLASVAADMGAAFVDVRFPNLYGEHGRAHYNSFVATFVQCVIDGKMPEVADRPIDLLHVQDAAQVLIDALTTSEERLDPPGTTTSVRDVLDKLRDFDALYSAGDIPPLLDDLDINLFNTLRAAKFPTAYPMALPQRMDARGSLVEVVRSHGGQGQTFVSTTRPGVTRGEHFHLRKVERFVVVDGEASISLRKMFTNEILSFSVDGRAPVLIDMPTLWSHNITNTGPSELITLFWTHELFSVEKPDTFPEPVGVIKDGFQGDYAR